MDPFEQASQMPQHIPAQFNAQEADNLEDVSRPAFPSHGATADRTPTD